MGDRRVDRRAFFFFFLFIYLFILEGLEYRRRLSLKAEWGMGGGGLEEEESLRTAKQAS